MALSGEGMLSPVPEFYDEGRNDSENRLPEFDEQDYRSHRNVYVGVHVPYSVPRNHKHHKRRRHRKRIHVQEGPSGRNTPLFEEVDHIEPPRTPVDPCDRVKFILGEETTDGSDNQHIPTHSLFTELEELCYDEHGDKVEWKETARWVKFEEDIEEGGEKWSKPHVASLSLHSLFDLRVCMVKGTVLLDLAAHNLEQISDCVLDHLVSTNQLEEENREKVHAALLQRHKHHCTKDQEKKRFPFTRLSLGDMVHYGSHNHKTDHQVEGGRGSVQSSGSFRSWFGHQDNGQTSRKESDESVRVHDVQRNNSHTSNGNGGDEPHIKFDQHFMKKLPEGSEASNVLVGEVDFLTHSIIAFVRLSEAQFLGDLTEVPIPTRFLFILLGPKGNHERYHEIGRAIATLMADEVFHEVAYKARNRGDLLAGIDEFLDQVTVLPPGEWDPQIRLEPPQQVPSQADRMVASKESKETAEYVPTIEFNKIPFTGLWSDIKRRYRQYPSDFKDSVWDTTTNRCSVLTLLSTIASIVFIYFANIAPAIIFGQVLSEKTDGHMGPVEMILSVGIGNFVYALTAGQPIVILGGTGPTLIFEDIVYKFCTQQDIPYLEFRFWIGLWTGLLLIILVICNASVIVRIFTRFTAEIFSALISFIFIYESIAKVWSTHLNNPYDMFYWFPFWSRKCDCYEFDSEENYDNFSMTDTISNATNLGSYWNNYANSTFLESCDEEFLRAWIGSDCPGEVHHDVFFFSIILFVGTFFVALYLKKFKSSPFFPSTVRRIISDFSVLISVVIWSLVNYFAHVQDVPSLEVPNLLQEGFYANNDSVRSSLFISPLGNGLPNWAPVAALVPSLLATILIFMDQQITALIINRKDHKLKKGPGYHLDLLIVGVLVSVFAILGLPWVVGATVRSIAHVQSLFLFSPSTAPGERPKFLGVKEQRITLLCMAVLLCLSVLMYQILQLIPLAVLYGLFLFIGVTSLNGVQFVERILIIFMPDKYKPDEEYIRHIPNRRLHLYTLVQIIMLCLLCVFNVVSQISILFPIMVLFLVFGRWLVGWFFPQRDLEILDEPIPEKLYCRRHCKRTCGSHDSEELDSEDVEKGLEMKTGNESDEHQNESLKTESTINITREVDRCDLWKHMVRSLDKEPVKPVTPDDSSTVTHSKVNGSARINLLNRFEKEGVNSEPVLINHQSLFKSTEI